MFAFLPQHPLFLHFFGHLVFAVLVFGLSTLCYDCWSPHPRWRFLEVFACCAAGGNAFHVLIDYFRGHSLDSCGSQLSVCMSRSQLRALDLWLLLIHFFAVQRRFTCLVLVGTVCLWNVSCVKSHVVFRCFLCLLSTMGGVWWRPIFAVPLSELFLLFMVVFAFLSSRSVDFVATANTVLVCSAGLSSFG